MARDAEVDASRESGREGCRRTVRGSGLRFVVELGRREAASRGCVIGGDPDPDLVLKAEKNDRGEGGEVDVDGCKRGRVVVIIGDDDVEVLGRGDEAVGASLAIAAFVVSSAAAFFRSSSSRF